MSYQPAYGALGQGAPIYVNQVPTETRQESPVAAALGRLVNTIGELELQIENLRDRLSPVLMPSAPQGNGAQATKDQSHSLGIVADNIDASSQRLGVLITAVNELRTRLAV